MERRLRLRHILHLLEEAGTPLPADILALRTAKDGGTMVDEEKEETVYTVGGEKVKRYLDFFFFFLKGLNGAGACPFLLLLFYFFKKK